MLRMVAVLFLGLLASAATAEDCQAIKFAKGTSSGEVSGQVTDGEARCFSFGAGAGQTARLQLSGSENACFTVYDIADCRTDLSFPTGARTYRLIVSQLFPAPRAEAFRLRLTIR